MTTLINRLLLGASIATAVLMLLVGYAYTVNPVEHAMVGPVGLFFPVILAVNVVFIILFLILKKYKFVLVPFVGMLLAYEPVRLYCPINTEPRVPAGCIRFMSYNTLVFRGQEKEYELTPDNPLVQYMMEKDCDIVCTQEDCYFLPDSVESYMKQRYPYILHIVNTKRSNSLGLYTKYPILESDTLKLGSKGNMVAVYKLKTPHCVLLVVNCHLETNGLSLDDKQNFKSMVKGEMARDSMEDESRGLFSKLAAASKIRSRQMQVVMDYVKEHKDMKIVLCGDFNENPLSYSHYLVDQELTDCYVTTATGLGWSYCHNGMRVRIDNIFCSKDISPYGCYVDDTAPFSDHFPILCKLKLD